MGGKSLALEQGIMTDDLLRKPQGVADNQTVLVVAHQHQRREIKAQQFAGKAGDFSVQTVQVNGADQALRKGEQLGQGLFFLFSLGYRQDQLQGRDDCSLPIADRGGDDLQIDLVAVFVPADHLPGHPLQALLKNLPDPAPGADTFLLLKGVVADFAHAVAVDLIHDLVGPEDCKVAGDNGESGADALGDGLKDVGGEGKGVGCWRQGGRFTHLLGKPRIHYAGICAGGRSVCRGS